MLGARFGGDGSSDPSARSTEHPNPSPTAMQYLLRRLVLSVLVLFGVSILIFTIVRLLPGDVIDMMIGTEGIDERQRAAHLARDRYGLNDAWPVQYVRWMGGILQGNLGTSFRTGQEVLPLIAARLPTTLELAFLAVLLSTADRDPARGDLGAVAQRLDRLRRPARWGWWGYRCRTSGWRRS